MFGTPRDVTDNIISIQQTMKTNLVHSTASPFYKPEGLQHNRDVITINTYDEGVWNGSKRYVH